MNLDKGRFDDISGDEDEIEAELRQRKQDYEDEHADDWKYDEDRG